MNDFKIPFTSPKPSGFMNTPLPTAKGQENLVSSTPAMVAKARGLDPAAVEKAIHEKGFPGTDAFLKDPLLGTGGGKAATAGEMAAAKAKPGTVTAGSLQNANTSGATRYVKGPTTEAMIAGKQALIKGIKDPGPGGPVYKMQEKLAAAGYKNADGTPLKLDGMMGPQTMAAVRKYQEDCDMEPTGKADRDTWGAIMSTLPEVTITAKRPEAKELPKVEPLKIDLDKYTMARDATYVAPTVRIGLK